MTPDGCRGSFHVHVKKKDLQGTAWVSSRGFWSPWAKGHIFCMRRTRQSAWCRVLRIGRKRGRKNPTQHRYHTTFENASQCRNVRRWRKSVPCTKTIACIWETFHLEKLKNPCYLIVTKRRYKNSKSSGGLPKANGKYGNQSDFKSK